MRAKRLIPLLAALLLLAACGLIAEDQEAAGGDLIYYLAEEASGSDAIRAEAAATPFGRRPRIWACRRAPPCRSGRRRWWSG